MKIAFPSLMLVVGLAVCGCSSNEATPTKVDPSAKIEPQDSGTKAKVGGPGAVRNLPGPGKK